MSALGPVYDDFGVPTNEPLDLRCRHDSVMTWGDHEGNRMWACSDCSRRMYPACPTCVDVGHRNEVHVPAMTATWKRRARTLRHYLDVLRREGYHVRDRARDVLVEGCDATHASDPECARNDLERALARYEEMRR